MADEDLARVLSAIRLRGGIGSQSIADAIAHSERFVAACPAEATLGVDLGSGGGLPALVLAVRRPALELHLIERRATRADLLRYGVSALGLADRVTVHTIDVETVPDLGLADRVDLVTARSFAPLLITLTVAARILGRRGSILISAGPGDPPRVDDSVLATAGIDAVDEEHGILCFRRD